MIEAHLRRFNQIHQWDVRFSTTHWWIFHVSDTSPPLWQEIKFPVIKGRLRPLNPKSEWEIHQVCPIRSFSLSSPHTTLSNKKLGIGANQICYL